MSEGLSGARRDWLRHAACAPVQIPERVRGVLHLHRYHLPHGPAPEAAQGGGQDGGRGGARRPPGLQPREGAHARAGIQGPAARPLQGKA